jgi:hypothetical protein
VGGFHDSLDHVLRDGPIGELSDRHHSADYVKDLVVPRHEGSLSDCHTQRVPALAIVLLKALAGGIFVVVFSAIGQVVRPKRFAGIFAAAPSIAAAGLLLAVLTRGLREGVNEAEGMMLGTAAMVVYCAVSLVTVERLHALAGSTVAWLAWALVAGGLYLVFFR